MTGGVLVDDEFVLDFIGCRRTPGRVAVKHCLDTTYSEQFAWERT